MQGDTQREYRCFLCKMLVATPIGISGNDLLNWGGWCPARPPNGLSKNHQWNFIRSFH